MKKSFYLLLLSFLLVFATLALTGCGDPDDGSKTPCEHVFDGKWGNDGTSHWKTCSKCGAAAPESEKAAHSWSSEDYVAKEATCTEEGILANNCTVCDYQKIAPIAKTKHDVGTTYHANETKHWQVCSLCNTELNKANHEYKTPKYDGDNHWLACKCDAAGTKTAHTWVNADENDNGLLVDQKCTGCEATRKDAPNADHTHTYNTGVITTPATDCRNPGVKTFTCTVENCGASYTESVTVPHRYNGEYKSDDTHHWQNCICGEAAPETEREAHNYSIYDQSTNSYKCECGKSKETTSGGGYVDPNGWT